MSEETPRGRRRSDVWIAIGLVAIGAAVAWGYLSEGKPKQPPQPAAVANAPAVAPTAAASAAAPVTAVAPSQIAAPVTGSVAAGATPAAVVAAPSGSDLQVAEKRPGPSPETTQVRGVIKPKEEVLFSSKISARISQMPYKEGARFKKGALLVGFDCTRLRAEANAAWAANRASLEIQKQSIALDSFNAIGKSDVQIARAKADQTAAEAAALESQVRDCSISAPFSGLVVENIAHQYENVAPGKDLTRVLNDEALEVHLVAPSAWLSWLRPGTGFQFKVDETGRTLTGKIIRLGASVDPVSQTVRVVGALAERGETVLPGMSGSASFREPPPGSPRDGSP